MRLLCLGCLHGKVPSRLVSRLRKERFDYVLCTGDMANGDIFRKLVFKYWALLHVGFSLEDLVEKSKLDRMKSIEIKSMQKPIKFLKSLNKPVFLVHGNNDYLRKHVKGLRLRPLEDRIKSSNIRLIDTKLAKLDDYSLIGDPGLRCYKPKRLKKVFSRARKQIIFITHCPVYGYFDVVKMKDSPRHGEHIGDRHYLKFVKRYKPILHVSSHMHEHQGMKRLGKTLIVNSGAAYLGRYAIIKLNGNKVKNVKFGR